ncbi:hypothetical protein M0802_000335 [Mischocyttarus mexicanus]|nr:hypothetical protein M0802_000335 [Mischocyttarus mexicanus]
MLERKKLGRIRKRSPPPAPPPPAPPPPPLPHHHHYHTTTAAATATTTTTTTITTTTGITMLNKRVRKCACARRNTRMRVFTLILPPPTLDEMTFSSRFTIK